jgi:hypothetical protein
MISSNYEICVIKNCRRPTKNKCKAIGQEEIYLCEECSTKLEEIKEKEKRY